METKYIAGIEIGSSKIKGAVGYVARDGALTVQAVEEVSVCDIVRYGIISNVEMVANSIGQLLDRLEERIAPRCIDSVYVNIGGISTSTLTVGVDRQLPEECEITASHIEKMKDEALRTQTQGRDIIAIEPKNFFVDRRATEIPEGMVGRSVRAEFSLITTRSQNKCNIKRVLTDKLGLKINDFIVRQLAEANLVLSQEEKRKGIVLVDFGAETTVVSVYKKGILQYLATLPLGSRNITKDLVAVHHLEEKAEEMKRKYGHAILPAPGSSDMGAEFTESNNYIYARVGEIIMNVKAQIEYSGIPLTDLAGGVVVVGDGALLRDFNTRMEQILKCPVRQGLPAPSVRIADSRIQPARAIDIIAVLDAAAKSGAVECTAIPEKEPETELDEQKPAAAETIREEKPKVAAPVKQQVEERTQKNPFWGNFRERLGQLMKGPMDQDDDFNDDVDE